MKKILINGEAWCRPLTGIERVTKEVVQELDTLVPPQRIELVLPHNAEAVPSLKNIAVVRLKQEAHFFPAWTQGAFQWYVLKHRGISLDFSNTCPFFAPGIEFIHDIYAKLFPTDFSTFRDRLIHFYTTLMYRTIAKRAKKILAVSEYTKKTIIDTYKIPPNKVQVVYSGIGTEYKKISADNAIFDRFPILLQKSFYFTLGSLSVRKNLKWILEHAKQFPEEHFVISGKPISSVLSPELAELNTLKNVTLTGYLSDGEVKALLQKCKAFIFPSYFEGFGIPPLEALYCGARIIISDCTSLSEIYGSCARYINPDEPYVNLDALLENQVTPPDALLEKFTLKNTALRLYDVLKDYWQL